MSDFYQTGVVATFHRLGKLDLEKIEDVLKTGPVLREKINNMHEGKRSPQ